MLTKVLLIDDSVTIHRVIDLSIDLEKFEITKVFSKDEATAKLSQSSYDYILLDNKLDNVHIIDYIKELKSGYPKCKVVLLVGAFDRFTDADLKITSADDFLVKPFDSQSLNSKLSDKSLPKPISPAPAPTVKVEAPVVTPILDNDISDNIEPVSDVEEIANIVDDTIDISDNDEINNIIADVENLNLDDVNDDATEAIIEHEDTIKNDDTFKHIVTEVSLDDVIDFDEDEIRKAAEELAKKDMSLNPTEIINDEIATNQLLDSVLADADEDVTVDDVNFDIPDIDLTDIDMQVTKDEPIDVAGSDMDELASLEFIDNPDSNASSENDEPSDDVQYNDDEMNKMRENLNLAFMNKSAVTDEISDEPIDIEEETEEKAPLKKNLFSYLETDLAKKPKGEDVKFDDDTVHKELVGNVLYEEVMMPTLADDDDDNIILKPKLQPIKKPIESKPDDDAEDGSKDLLYSALHSALSKEFIEDSIKDILAKNIKEAVKDIIPNLAEKYILEEIERLKEDEKED